MRRPGVGGAHGIDQGLHHLALDGGTSTCRISRGGADLGELRLRIPGRHYVLDAVAALALGLQLGFSFDALTEGLAAFTGTGRRMELKGEAAGVRVVVEVVEDRPAPALVAVADEHDAEVIVVGIWNESPLRGLLLGSVAHKLLQLSDRPVLCVPGGDSLPRHKS